MLHFILNFEFRGTSLLLQYSNHTEGAVSACYILDSEVHGRGFKIQPVRCHSKDSSRRQMAPHLKKTDSRKNKVRDSSVTRSCVRICANNKYIYPYPFYFMDVQV